MLPETPIVWRPGSFGSSSVRRPVRSPEIEVEGCEIVALDIASFSEALTNPQRRPAIASGDHRSRNPDHLKSMHFVAIKAPEQMDLLAVRRVALAHPHASLVELLVARDQASGSSATPRFDSFRRAAFG